LISREDGIDNSLEKFENLIDYLLDLLCDDEDQGIIQNIVLLKKQVNIRQHLMNLDRDKDPQILEKIDLLNIVLAEDKSESSLS